MKRLAPTDAVPALADAMLACLEDFLPGGSEAQDPADSAALKQQVHQALTKLEDRLATASHTLQAPDDYRALAAARQAVQSGLLSLQLFEAGRRQSEVI